jgi:hypothetical protein
MRTQIRAKMAALRVEALHAYRHLMRAQRHRFAGDLEMYRAARNEVRGVVLTRFAAQRALSVAC